MLPAIEQLLVLRERDRALIQAHAQLEGLASERHATTTRSAAAERASKDARQRAQELETQRRQCDLEIASKQDQIGKYAHQQLQTRKNEEYQALGKEMEHCKTAIRSTEDKELEIMEAAEAHAKVLKHAQTTLDAANKDTATALAAIDEREGNLRGHLQLVQTQRGEFAAAMDETVLARYERLLIKKGTSAISGIDHASCGACHMKLPPQVMVNCKHGKEINFCPHCGAILYYSAEMDLVPAEE